MSNNPPRTVKKHQIKTKRMKQLYVLLFFCLTSVINANAKENTAPLAPAATITGGTTVCQNAASPLITFTGSGGTAPYTFTYKINNGPDLTVATTSGNTVTVSAPTGTAGTFTYSLVSQAYPLLPHSAPQEFLIKNDFLYADHPAITIACPPINPLRLLF